MAIITVFWQDHIGLSLAEILLVNVFFSGVNLLMEYPSGYVSDRLGYRRSLIIACMFGIAGWSVYLKAGSFWHVIGAEMLLGVCYAFISGSDTALLYETLKDGGRTELYNRLDGRMVTWAQSGEALGALCAGLLYVRSPLLPFIVQVGVWSLALLLAFSLREPAVEASPHRVSSHLQEAARIGRYALTEKPILRATMVFGVLLGLASFYPVWLVQPFMRECGVPLTLVRADLGRRQPDRGVLRLSQPPGSGPARPAADVRALRGPDVVGYLGLGLTGAMGSFLFYYLLTAMRGLQGPMLRSVLQHHASRWMRASILSLHSLLFRLGYVVAAGGGLGEQPPGAEHGLSRARRQLQPAAAAGRTELLPRAHRAAEAAGQEGDERD